VIQILLTYVKGGIGLSLKKVWFMFIGCLGECSHFRRFLICIVLE
jgi:hypothetical protein